MDSFIEWLVILFLIVSFLNSILKPKKTSQKGTPANPRERVITSGPTVDIPDVQTDIREALKQRKSVPQKKKTSIIDDFDKRYSEQRVFENRQKELSKSVKKKKSDLEQLAIDDLLKEKQAFSTARNNLTRSLLNPESARNAVLLAEILGKPKALKRRW